MGRGWRDGDYDDEDGGVKNLISYVWRGSG